MTAFLAECGKNLEIQQADPLWYTLHLHLCIDGQYNTGCLFQSGKLWDKEKKRNLPFVDMNRTVFRGNFLCFQLLMRTPPPKFPKVFMAQSNLNPYRVGQVHGFIGLVSLNVICLPKDDDTFRVYDTITWTATLQARLRLYETQEEHDFQQDIGALPREHIPIIG